MEQKPRWAEMCARILQQCEVILGGREKLAEFLSVHPTQVALWTGGKSGPPREVFDKAIDVILAEHDRRAGLETTGAMPQRRASDASRTSR
jgi:DNA-binding transcriptional regulator YdaS (Cro superfamily)